jgi:hypothetical protein
MAVPQSGQAPLRIRLVITVNRRRRMSRRPQEGQWVLSLSWPAALPA